ncbi:MAG: hypothetical protein ACHQ01_09670 [Candidatus Limnocylindrales bacterium]
MTDAQSDIVRQVFPLLDSLSSRQTDVHARDSLLAAMRAGRWWCVAAGQLDREEASLAERGGFLVEIERDEAFEAALLSYYSFGNMVLDRLAAFATGTDVDGAWKAWLQTMDRGLPTQTRALARQLDIDLRVTRDKLATHLGVDAKLTWGLSGAASSRLGAFRISDEPLPPEVVAELNVVAKRIGAETIADNDRYAALILMEAMRERADHLDERGRNAYRAAANLVGAESPPVSDVTWRVVALVRSFG